MRLWLPFCMFACYAANVTAQDEAVSTPPAPVLAKPGHAFPNDESQISVEIRHVTTSARFLKQWREQAVRLTSPAAAPLQLTELADDRLTENGVQLVSASTVQETVQTVWARLLTDPEVDGLLRRLQQDDRSNILSAPKVAVFNRQIATVADVIQRPVGTPADAADPQSADIIVLESGTKIRLRCRTLPDGGVRLDCKARISAIDVRAGAVTSGVAAPATTSVRRSEAEVCANVPAGETLVVWGMRNPLRPEPRKVRGVSTINRMLGSNPRTAVHDEILVLLLKPQIISAQDSP